MQQSVQSGLLNQVYAHVSFLFLILSCGEICDMVLLKFALIYVR